MNKPTILITGANGQLGQSFQQLANSTLAQPCHLLFTDKRSLNISDSNNLQIFLQQQPIRFIINCAAFTHVDKAQQQPDACMLINHLAVKHLGQLAAQRNIRLIHISTDYVFDGTNNAPYRETDPTNPINTYGQSKLLGEQALQQTCPQAIIIRTAWLFSQFGNNFPKTILQLAKQQQHISIVNDQIGSPTSAHNLAQHLLAIIRNTVTHNTPWLPGIYHYANTGEPCSRYQLAKHLLQLAHSACQPLPISTKDLPTPLAPRPPYTPLNTHKFQQTFHLTPPPWPAALQPLLP